MASDKPVGLLTAPTRTFHPGDYAVFALTLAVAVVIGLYYGIRYRKFMSVRDMLLGGQALKPLPVALSLVATLSSTVFVLGVPSEIYYGQEFPIFIALAFIPATIFTAHVFIPMYHSLGVTSAYEYLGLRFNKIVRFGAALIYIVMMNFTQALSIYTPAVGFSLVAGVSLEVSILTAGVVCTFYTAIGGIRAVIVTDIFQIVTILGGILGMLIKGAIEAGGIEKIFENGSPGEKLNLWSLKYASRTNYSFWAQLFGGSVTFMSVFGVNQQNVQRYCSIKKCRDAQKAAYLAMVFYVIMWVLVLLVGLVVYSFYFTCDPLVSHVIYSPDQVLPLFIMDTIGHLHGLPGLFSAAVFGAVLSTTSSTINSMAAVTLEDVIRPLHYHLKKTDVSESYSKAITRSLAMFYGVLSIGLSYIPVKYGTYLMNLDVSFSTYGVLGGPIMGAFLLGMMIPIANSLGTGIGILVGILFGLWMWIGRMVCRSSDWQPPTRELSTACQDYYNLTSTRDDSYARSSRIIPGEGIWKDCPLQEFYNVSFLWYGFICLAVTMAVGILVSLISGGHGGKKVSSDLLCWNHIKKKWRERRSKNKTLGLFTWPTFKESAGLSGPNPLMMKTDPTPRQLDPNDILMYVNNRNDADVLFTGHNTQIDQSDQVLYENGKLHSIPQSNGVIPRNDVFYQPGRSNPSFVLDNQREMRRASSGNVLYQGHPIQDGFIPKNMPISTENPLSQTGKNNTSFKQNEFTGGFIMDSNPEIQPGALRQSYAPLPLPSGYPGPRTGSPVPQAEPPVLYSQTPLASGSRSGSPVPYGGSPESPVLCSQNPGQQVLYKSSSNPNAAKLYSPATNTATNTNPTPVLYTSYPNSDPTVLFNEPLSTISYPQIGNTYGTPLVLTSQSQPRLYTISPETQLTQRHRENTNSLWS